MTGDRNEQSERFLTQLEQDARVRRVSRMIPDSGPLTARQCDEVVEAIRTYQAEYDVSQTALASGIGEPASTVGYALSGNMERIGESKRSDVLRALNNWIELDASQRASAAPENFVKTRVASRLFTIAKEIRDASTMGYAYGPAGIGKSVCSKALVAEISGSIYVLVTRAKASGAGLISGIFAASRRKNRARFRPRYEDLTATLEGSGRLLIVDQFHRLKPAAIEVLQDLHDECGIPILCVGTIDGHRKISDEGDGAFGQISSRFTIRRNLFPEMAGLRSRGGGKSLLAGKLLFTVEEIRAIYAGAKLKLHPAAIEALTIIANCPDGRGHLRRVDAIVHWALRSAAKSGRAMVTTEDIDNAMRVVVDPVEGAIVPAPPITQTEERRATA